MRRKEIGLAFPRGAHQEVIIEGILQYAREADCDWSFIVAPEWSAVSLTNLLGWPGDGVIAALNTVQEAACVKRFRTPIVNISGVLKKSPTPRVTVDNYAIGTLAAEHLLSRGFKKFAYYGMTDVQYSTDRFNGYKARLAEAGFTADEFSVPATFAIRGNSWLRQQSHLTAWLATLKFPIGVFSASDARARQVIDACNELQIHVPDEVAVLGVDDQQIICEHCHPMISSVGRNALQEGYLAAKVLDRLMKRRGVPPDDQLIPPTGVVVRESTSTMAVSDERIRSALDFIQANLEAPVTVADVCTHADVSRRWLEYAFRNEFGDTPSNYLRRRRLEHAKDLLVSEPKTKIDTIARRTGYSSSNQLAKAFRREFGSSPRDFRKSMQSEITLQRLRTERR
ncbi:MAG: DNA-binding transcriptional regulator [Planctomycetales bacterium]|nr:DNA-binding transcriptional regulator [Planctomycetales bacterium]